MEKNDKLQLFPEDSPLPDYQLLYKEVFSQITKDFAPVSIETALPEHLTAEWIFSQTESLIRQVLSESPGHFSNIIYRIDLPEKKSRAILSGHDAEEKIGELASMIVRREAQKVWFRSQFRS